MKYRYKVNAAGIIYLAITLLVGVAATIRPNNILVWVFGLLLALIAISGLVSGAALYRMSVRRIDPGHGRVGRPLVVRYAVRGGSRWFPLYDLSVTELPGDSVAEIMTVMTEKRIRHLPVVSGGKLAGIVSIGDAVKMRLGEIEHEADAMRAYIAGN